ncbi:transmembrane protein 267 [Epargyreus clarus]|uniref:transmembrane protein 267 n=1 Tax=Epargyreus clarus TaxID=520877 RepID=UPI003C2D6ACA
MKHVKLIFSFSICCAAFIGDYVVFKSKMAESFAFRAVADSFTHATIGFLSALLFFSHDISVTSQVRVYNIIFCTIISSLIDIDHAFVARSFYLKDYTNLKQRGIFHCTTFWATITALLLIYSNIVKKLNIYLLTWMLILAFTSHHIRDANRRGLWLYPYGHSAPIPKYLYIMLISTLPIIFAYIFTYFKPPVKHSVVQYL